MSNVVHPHQWTDGGDHVLILRRVDASGLSYGEFRWPEGVDVEVTAPDWNAEPVCGGGLHGWPWGLGIGDGMPYSLIDDRWIVLAAKPEDVVGNLKNGEKCKCRTAMKLFDGPFTGAWALVNGGRHRLIEAMAKSGFPYCASGYYSIAASAGYYSIAGSAGDSSRAASAGNLSSAASSGDYSSAASSGDYSSAASAGNLSRAASSGDYSIAGSAGNSSRAASAGNSSRAASAGDYSSAASSGDYSRAASSGDYSSAASSGDYSSAASSGKNTLAVCAGRCCRVRVGERGAFAIPFWSDVDGWRFLCGKVGENGIKADTWYEVVDGKLAEIHD